MNQSNLSKKLIMEKTYRKIDDSNMHDLLVTFKKRNEDAVKKQTKIQLCSTLIETCPEFIPNTISELTSIKKRFNKAADSAGLPSLGPRELKAAICLCIYNLLKLATPELANESDFTFAKSLTAAEVNSKFSKALLLYKLALPSIRQYIVYSYFVSIS